MKCALRFLKLTGDQRKIKELRDQNGSNSVSDGHGSDKCFRSHIGSNLAAEVADTACRRFLRNFESPKFPAMQRWVERSLPREIVYYWKQEVIDDLSEKPFTREELKTMELREGIEARRRVVSYPILAYGATLLTLVITEGYLLYLQVGDGDILTVSDDGQVKKIFAKDERLYANETTSICLPQAWRDFKVSFQPDTEHPPALILLSTDGYSDSFSTEKEFLQIGPDILKMIRSDGLDKVNDHLEAWLDETSRIGSGDDITLGVVCRMDIFQKKEEKLEGEGFPAPPYEIQNMDFYER